MKLRLAFTLLLVDDGSTDGTPIILNKLALQHGVTAVRQANAGHGAAVMNGYRRALSATLRQRWVIGVIFVAVIGGMYWLFTQLKSEL